MASISSPNVLQIKNAANVTVVGFARSIRFFGGIVVTDVSNGQADVDGTGAAGNPWDVLGNAGGGLVLGTNTADAWNMIVNGLVRAGFESDGRYFVSSPGSKRHILSINVIPTVGAGVAADIGSIALANIAGIASAWLKTGAADTAWSPLSVTSSLDWGLTGSILSGGSPTTPNEFLGSLNDYDVVFQRNSTEVARFVDSGGIRGLVIGHPTFVGTSPASLQLTASSSGAVVQRNVFDPASNSVLTNQRVGRLSTNGAASATLDVGFQNDRSQYATVSVIGKRTGGGSGSPGDTIVFENRLLISDVAGVVTLIDDTPVVAENSLIPGTSVSYSAIGGIIRLQVNGVAGYNIKWGIRWDALDA